MPASLLPQINVERCNGCQRCIDVCPTDALEMVDGKAQLSRPELCVYCTVCERICPEVAISLPFLIVFAPSQSTARRSRS